jgi:hypothetical protein
MRELRNSQRARQVRSASFIAETLRTQSKRGEHQAQNGYGEWGGGFVFRQVQRARRAEQVRQIRYGLTAVIMQLRQVRPAFLLQTIAVGIVLAFGSLASEQVDTVLGDWHLIEASADGTEIPEHRMDLRFQNSSGSLRGAILSRRDGSEIALASSEFDGSTLRFQLRAPEGKAQAEMPTMVMTSSRLKKGSGSFPTERLIDSEVRVSGKSPDPVFQQPAKVGDNFEGAWTDSAGRTIGPRFKLVRASH